LVISEESRVRRFVNNYASATILVSTASAELKLAARAITALGNMRLLDTNNGGGSKATWSADKRFAVAKQGDGT